MKLPNGNRAQLGNKIDDYCLNSNHRKGQHKARLFASRLGITRENSEILKNAIYRAVISEDATLRKTNEYGQHYNLKFRLKTDFGSSLILTAWIIRSDENFPRLTNCYPVNHE
ncbi:hypothetical protein E1H12_18445 [Geitlerinema sp. P-1104]|uniref:DUF6883 domain-containing protein n=1 Tax=Geitlerinema sp. P-1104 TaxID=2546230 RepID=UPI0014775F1C|nr:DUF6883 domain-containing protein [Geitlerinema sp. P-1104]NMG60438.1 hypothetical protein [Geitlerinema sp. P-1104]